MLLIERLRQYTARDGAWSVFVKFCVVGVVTTLIQLAIFKSLLLAHAEYQLASLSGILVATTMAYVGNRLWAFRSTNGILRESIKFYASRSVTIPINAGCLWLFVSGFQMEKVLSQALSIGIVTIINFYVGKKIVFSRANSHNPTIVDSVPIVTDGE